MLKVMPIAKSTMLGKIGFIEIELNHIITIFYCFCQISCHYAEKMSFPYERSTRSIWYKGLCTIGNQFLFLLWADIIFDECLFSNFFQIWRLFTSIVFFPLSPMNGFHYLINLYFLYNYSTRLESGENFFIWRTFFSTVINVFAQHIEW